MSDTKYRGKTLAEWRAIHTAARTKVTLPALKPTSFEEYLSRPCDKCERTATHNQPGGKVCNAHIDDSQPAFARND